MDKKGTLLVVDDKEQILSALEQRLGREGFEVHTAQSGWEALSKARLVFPDLILLDVRMPGITGFEVKAKLNEDDLTADIPVIFLSGEKETENKVSGFQLRADDYVTKPFDFVELLARVLSAIDRRRRYEATSMTDGLTGLYNVHAFKKQVKLFFEIARRYNRVFSVVVIDIDDMKTINDSFGHTTGDFVIIKVAEAMKQIFRKMDVLVRYGGDEFVAILPESGEKKAEHAVKRFRDQIDGKEWLLNGAGQKIRFSVSVGVAVYNPEISQENQLFDLADRKMYEDKISKKG